MAITYTAVSVNGVNRDAIVLQGTGETQEVIFKDYLSPNDEAVFEAINDTAGADFLTKFNAYTLENGRPASEVYGDFIKVVGDIELAVRRRIAESLSVSEIIQLQDDLAAAQAV